MKWFFYMKLVSVAVLILMLIWCMTCEKVVLKRLPTAT